MPIVDRTSVTYCLSHSIVLTHRCANACGYCDFLQLPKPPLPSKKRLQRLVRAAVKSGAVEMELMAGEEIAEFPDIVGSVHYFGLKDYWEYLQLAFSLAAQSNGHTGVLPVPNLGYLSLDELYRLKQYVPCIRLLFESSDPLLVKEIAHEASASKSPERRLEMILNAGVAQIPITTGILVGIGENKASREKTLKILAEVHRKYGHIQNIVIERFKPRPGTPMADWPECPAAEVQTTVAVARRIFGPSHPITVNIFQNPDLLNSAIEAGASDFGQLRVNGAPEQVADALRRLAMIRSHCLQRGFDLEERLPVFRPYQNEKWLSPGILELVNEWHQREQVAEVE